MLGTLLLLSGSAAPFQGLIQPPLSAAAVSMPEIVTAAVIAEEPAPQQTTVTTSAAQTTSFTTSITTVITTTAAAKSGASETSADADGFVYSVSEDHASLHAYTGTAQVLQIPATFQNLPVTEIESRAFDSNKTLTSVTIPAGITKIGSYAFNSCSMLESVSLPDSLTTIGYYAFANTKLKTVDIPASVSEAEYAFHNCKVLESVSFARTMTEIPQRIVTHCAALSEIRLPDQLTKIGYYAFCENPALTELVLPDSLKTIGNGAFQSCTGLKSVTLPEGLETIGDHVFHSCKALESVTLPESLKSLGYYAFAASGLTAVNVPASLEKVDYSFASCKSLTSVRFADGIRAIPGRIFSNCSALESVTIPETVTEIGNHAFNSCKALKSLTVPESVKKIGDYAFQYCTALKTVQFSEGLETLGNYAFADTGITSVTVPASMKETSYPFSHCQSLTEIRFATGLTAVPTRIFANVPALKSVKIPYTVTQVGSYAFSGCSALCDLEISGSVETIGEKAFERCTALEYVTLPEGLQTLELYAFARSGLREIVIPASLKKTAYPFAECAALKQIRMPEKITEIPSRIFANCTGLTAFEVPATVKEIGDYAFSDCRALETITLPDGLQKLGFHAFANSSVHEITIPASVQSAAYPFTGSALKTVHFADSITAIPTRICAGCTALESVTMPETVTNIGAYAFNSCFSLESVTLPSHLQYLAQSCFAETGIKEITLPASLQTAVFPFEDCHNLETVHFPDGITEILPRIFAKCSGLRYIVIPDTVQTVGELAFYNCENLETVTLPEGVQTLARNAFSNTGLKSVTIPASVCTAAYAFSNCAELETVTFAEGMTNIPDRIFSDEKKLHTVQLPASVISIGSFAFYQCEALSKVLPADVTPQFRNNSFYGCKSFFDSRFTFLDREACGITGAAASGRADGVINFTVKYQLRVQPKRVKIELSLPDSLDILPDTVICSDPEAEAGSHFDSFSCKAPQGTIHFSAKFNQKADEQAVVTADVRFRYQDAEWFDTIGSTAVQPPVLTLNAPETVSGTTVKVSGFAGIKQDVGIYLNDTLVQTVTAKDHTGKYSTVLDLPEIQNGGSFTVCAKTETGKTEPVRVTYIKNACTIESVQLYYGDRRDLAKDITEVFTECKSPVLTMRPGQPFHFVIKAANSALIDKLYVTSTKNGNMKSLEAFYDEKADEWITTDGYFDAIQKSYVPGVLNISILAKQPEINMDEAANEIFEESKHLPEATAELLKESSSAEILEQTENRLAAKITVDDGNMIRFDYGYYAEHTDSVPIGGKTVTAAEIAKDPAKYGYRKSGVTYTDDAGTHTYYVRMIGADDDLAASALELLGDSISELENCLSGVSVLEIIEKQAYGEDSMNEHEFAFALTNEILSSPFGDAMELIASDYGLGMQALSIVGDSVDFAARMYRAQSEEEQLIASLIFTAQFLADIGAVDMALTAAVGTTAFGPVIVIVAGALISVSIDWFADQFDEYMLTHAVFSVGGFIRFVIDPSGTVYEAVLSNPVEGAEVTIYCLDPESGKETLWNAADYEQQNPQLTGEDGAYAWDVPEGKWKVVCKKEGFDTAESEWMDVPPIRTNVLLSIVDHSAPEIAEITAHENGILVRFSKYIDMTTANAQAIRLDGVTAYSVLPVLHAPEDAYTDTFLISGAMAAGEQKVSITEALRSYAGTAAAASEKTVTLKDAIRKKGDLNGDNKCSIADAVLMNRLLAEEKTETDAAVWSAADMDSDGIITALDLRILLRGIAVSPMD